MIVPPAFASHQEFVSRLDDIEFWQPFVAAILARHSLADAGREPVAGFHGTWPTFLAGDVVVKLFGFSPPWRTCQAAECAAQARLAADPAIAAPRLLAEGRMSDAADAPWPYLITTRMTGVSWANAGLSPEQRVSVATDLGRQIRRVHALPLTGAVTPADRPNLNVARAAAQGSLPPHLIVQIDDYLAQLGPFDPVFVHGDLVANHAFVENGRLAGIIDWGDAMVTDRHYEIIQIFRDTFACDKALLHVFLEAADWPVGSDFARKALGHALHRQAVGLTQHPTMDVFEPIAALLPLQDIATLDDLATELFAV